MGTWWSRLEEKLGGGPGGPNRANTFRWLLIAGGVGAIFMIVNSFLTVTEVPPYRTGAENGSGGEPSASEAAPAFQSNAGKESKFAEFEAAYENSIKDILQSIVGVGEVQVLVTVESTEEIVVERNMTESQQLTDEKDRNGVSRHITQTTRNGQIVLHNASGGQTPIVRKTIRPTIRGVLIVAEGAENIAVKKLITEAVERGLGVPAHRISIAPSKR